MKMSQGFTGEIHEQGEHSLIQFSLSSNFTILGIITNLFQYLNFVLHFLFIKIFSMLYKNR